MLTRRAALLVAGIVLGSACAGNQPPSTPTGEPAALTLAECALPDLEERALCGGLEVFEHRGAGAGRRIRLRVAVLPALGPTPRPDPVFVLVGGPGQSAVDNAASYARLLAPLRDERDLVFADQRGTGGSNPLPCDLYADEPSGTLGDFLPIDAVRKCRDLLVHDADLRFYSSSLAAEDLDDVRAALGYERINLEAASYGTRVALLYLSAHSDRVRTAVLRSVSPPWVKQPLHFAEDAQAAFDSLAAACGTDPSCRAAFPDFEDELASVLARLDVGGVDVERPSADGAPPRTIQLTRGAFAEKVRIMLYAPELSSLLPLLVHLAAEGDFGPFAELAEEIGQQIARVGANGMYLSVTCAEDVARITPEEAANPWPGTFLGDWRVRQQRAACAIWPLADLPADFADPVRSDVPVLLFSSTTDPITPPRWAVEVAERLGNARHVRVPNASHSPANECVMAIERDFFLAGSHEGLDLACLEDIRRPPFIVQFSE
jgi:pimeloyl-ACP methyl ester carboxylesterase